MMKHVRQLTSEIETLSEKFKTMVELYIDRELKEDEDIHVTCSEEQLDFFIEIFLDDDGSRRIFFTLPICIYYDCRNETYTYTMESLNVRRENDD